MKVIKDEFIKTLKKFSEADPKIILTHAWHESGNFRKVIGYHNYWGIKKPRNWDGVTVPILTHESYKKLENETVEHAMIRMTNLCGNNIEHIDDTGNYWSVCLPQYFIDFPTAEFALLWYFAFLKRMYPEAAANLTNPEKFFSGLVNFRFKYATDPKYYSKLMKLYNTIS